MVRHGTATPLPSHLRIVMIHDKLAKKEYVNPFKRSKVINVLVPE